ncbi:MULTISPECIES: RHS repeat-associated core domain-containing protein [unclassified Caballeronia]|nr:MULTISPECIES: RHS repeat-associated core domain-containing protein [unclassified Caballeronia]MDR5775590.1 RHS repeat-associated core domain-containing protein [Caballeronia sp. LZ002]MDR5802315.1 RHS repeat-associated core domain-containing protein [Caballeronia sp. LZ001]MDR5851028.1 RHS repeat-associated core domain-containing protein [Caballeronia sp. LZ003]
MVKRSEAPGLPGYGGERRDAVSGAYHLGNGYRAYSPSLMRFTCPDSLSPFQAGGINPYAYCAGDPINRLDPSGHLSWQAWMGIGLGVVGLGLAAFTAGTSIAAAGGVIAAIESASAVGLAVGTAGVFADLTAIASGAFEDSHPKASAVLGWLSLGAGVFGFLGSSAIAIRRRAGYGRVRAMSIELHDLSSVPGCFVEHGTASIIPSFSPFVYVDLCRRMHRLNVVAQSRIVKGKVWLQASGTRFVNPRGLAEALRSSKDFEVPEFARFRLVAGYTALHGSASFAARLARDIQRPVEGYEGTVRLSRPLSQGKFRDIMEAFWNRSEGIEELEPFRFIGEAEEGHEILDVCCSSYAEAKTFYP